MVIEIEAFFARRKQIIDEAARVCVAYWCTVRYMYTDTYAYYLYATRMQIAVESYPRVRYSYRCEIVNRFANLAPTDNKNHSQTEDA